MERRQPNRIQTPVEHGRVPILGGVTDGAVLIESGAKVDVNVGFIGAHHGAGRDVARTIGFSVDCVGGTIGGSKVGGALPRLLRTRLRSRGSG